MKLNKIYNYIQTIRKKYKKELHYSKYEYNNKVLYLDYNFSTVIDYIDHLDISVEYKYLKEYNSLAYINIIYDNKIICKLLKGNLIAYDDIFLNDFSLPDTQIYSFIRNIMCMVEYHGFEYMMQNRDGYKKSAKSFSCDIDIFANRILIYDLYYNVLLDIDKTGILYKSILRLENEDD